MVLIEEAAALPLAAWESFYVIVGSAGAALTGLQFVAIAIIADSRRRSTLKEISAFGTPTIVHFCGVLLMSAIVSAPWQGLGSVRLALGACGIAGIVYGLITVRRTMLQTGYRPVFEDWLWHAALPLLAYSVLLIAALFLPGRPHRSLFAIGAVALLLLFIGIHNAWDAVTYITLGDFGKSPEPQDKDLEEE
jgi:hypothetical protein